MSEKNAYFHQLLLGIEIYLGNLQKRILPMTTSLGQKVAAHAFADGKMLSGMSRKF